MLTHHSIADHSDEILKIKARNVLNENELLSFGFYLKEYRLARLSLISFLSALSDLLRTPDKVNLRRIVNYIQRVSAALPIALLDVTPQNKEFILKKESNFKEIL